MTISGISSNTNLTGLSTVNTQNTSVSNNGNPLNPVYHHHHGGKKGGAPNLDKIVSQLQAKLGLNDNQMIDLKKILQKDLPNANTQNQQANAQGTTSSTTSATTSATTSTQPSQQSFKAIFDQLNKDINSILTPDQQKTFASLIQSRQNGGQGAAQQQGTGAVGGDRDNDGDSH